MNSSHSNIQDADGIEQKKDVNLSGKNVPLVSVIVLSDQHPSELEYSLVSIINQQYPNFEIIVINDGNNEPDEVLRKLEEKHSITYLAHTSKRGKNVAFNNGIRIANGIYLVFLNEGDCFYPEHLSTLVNVLETNPKLLGAWSGAFQVTRRSGALPPNQQDRQPIAVKRSQGNKLPVCDDVPLLCFMFRGNMIEKMGYFDETASAQPTLQWISRICRAGLMTYSPAATCEHHIEPEIQPIHDRNLDPATRLDLLLSEEDISAALEQHRDWLDQALLDLVKKNAYDAKDDGDLELAEGLLDLAGFIDVILQDFPENHNNMK